MVCPKPSTQLTYNLAVDYGIVFPAKCYNSVIAEGNASPAAQSLSTAASSANTCVGNSVRSRDSTIRMLLSLFFIGAPLFSFILSCCRQRKVNLRTRFFGTGHFKAAVFRCEKG